MQVPAVQGPVVQAPAVQAPVVQTPAVQAPAVQTPVMQAPEVQAPAVQAPAVQAPVVQAPAVQAPAVQAPAVQTTAVQAPAVQVPAVQAPSGSEGRFGGRDASRFDPVSGRSEGSNGGGAVRRALPAYSTFGRGIVPRMGTPRAALPINHGTLPRLPVLSAGVVEQELSVYDRDDRPQEHSALRAALASAPRNVNGRKVERVPAARVNAIMRYLIASAREVTSSAARSAEANSASVTANGTGNRHFGTTGQSTNANQGTAYRSVGRQRGTVPDRSTERAPYSNGAEHGATIGTVGTTGTPATMAAVTAAAAGAARAAMAGTAGYGGNSTGSSAGVAELISEGIGNGQQTVGNGVSVQSGANAPVTEDNTVTLYATVDEDSSNAVTLYATMDGEAAGSDNTVTLYATVDDESRIVISHSYTEERAASGNETASASEGEDEPRARRQDDRVPTAMAADGRSGAADAIQGDSVTTSTWAEAAIAASSVTVKSETPETVPSVCRGTGRPSRTKNGAEDDATAAGGSNSHSALEDKTAATPAGATCGTSLTTASNRSAWAKLLGDCPSADDKTESADSSRAFGPRSVSVDAVVDLSSSPAASLQRRGSTSSVPGTPVLGGGNRGVWESMLSDFRSADSPARAAGERERRIRTFSQSSDALSTVERRAGTPRRGSTSGTPQKASTSGDAGGNRTPWERLLGDCPSSDRRSTSGDTSSTVSGDIISKVVNSATDSARAKAAGFLQDLATELGCSPSSRRSRDSTPTLEGLLADWDSVDSPNQRAGTAGNGTAARRAPGSRSVSRESTGSGGAASTSASRPVGSRHAASRSFGRARAFLDDLLVDSRSADLEPVTGASEEAGGARVKEEVGGARVKEEVKEEPEQR